MKAEGQVGPQALADGTSNEVRLGRLGGLIVAELHGKYYEETYRGNIFHATMTAGVIFPTQAATSPMVMTLANPAGSGKNLVLVSFDMVITTLNATPATGAFALYVNTNVVQAAVTGTVITPIPGLIGSNNQPVAKAFSSSNIQVAPTIWLPFGYKETGGVVTATPITGLPSYHIDFDGKAIIAPGAAVTPHQTANDTTNATVLCSFCWEEVLI